MSDTKEPERPDYEDVKSWACSYPAGLEKLLARALWLEERITELERDQAAEKRLEG